LFQQIRYIKEVLAVTGHAFKAHIAATGLSVSLNVILNSKSSEDV